MPIMDIQFETKFKRIQPQAKLPLASVMRTLSISDQRLLEQCLSEPLECIFDPSFRRAEIESVLFEPFDVYARPTRRAALSNDDSGVDLWGTSERHMTLTAIGEQHLFQKFNYCRYRVVRLVRAFKGKRLTARAARDLLHWHKLALELRGLIVQANLPLVLAMAKRARISGVDFGELVSEGDFALLRSVDKFDFGRGFKFSTYGCRAILKSFSRVAERQSRYRGLCPTEYDPSLEKSDYLDRKRVVIESEYVDELKTILDSNAAELSDVERRVIDARFSLDLPPVENEAPKLRTLEEVGSILRVTKERVRQIQNRALGKIRDALHERVVEE